MNLLFLLIAGAVVAFACSFAMGFALSRRIAQTQDQTKRGFIELQHTLGSLRNDLALARVLASTTGPLMIEVPEALCGRLEAIATVERVHRLAVARIALEKGLTAWMEHHVQRSAPLEAGPSSSASAAQEGPAFEGFDEEEKTTLFDAQEERPTREMPLPAVLERTGATHGVRWTPTRVTGAPAADQLNVNG